MSVQASSDALIQWFLAQPAAVQRLVVEFPPGMRLVDDAGVVMWVVGYVSLEDGMPLCPHQLILSAVNPHVDYATAVAPETAHRYVLASEARAALQRSPG